MDLAAINIQRGRDHGIPPYIAWRKPCGLSPLTSWDDLDRIMSADTAGRLRVTYNAIEDIDLYVAGLAEKPVRGGLLGPTFACIIAQQFSNLRKGDRFWYENGGLESSFTPAQLQQIRKLTFAEIICRTMTEVETLQPFVFMSPDMALNPREECKNLVNFDLGPWTEKLPNFIKIVPKRDNNFKGENNFQNKRRTDPINIDLPAHRRRLLRLTKTELTKTDKKVDENTTDKQSIDTEEREDQSKERTKNRPMKLTKRNVDQIPFVELLTNFRATTDDPTDRTAKRKRQNKRKTKPTRRPNTTLLVTYNTNKVKVKQRPSISSTTPAVKFYYDDSHYGVDYIPDVPTYKPPVSTGRPPNDQEISIIVPAQRPEELSYLINTVTKPPSSGSSRPDYNIHIQINYYLNSTDKNKLKPQSDYTQQVSYHSDNPNNPYTSVNNFDAVDYGQSNTRPYYSSTTPSTAYYSTSTPYKRATKRPTTPRPYYSATTTYYSSTKRPTYSTTKTYYTSPTTRTTTTQRPFYTSNRPYVLSHSQPISVVYPSRKPTTTKRPNVIIIENGNPTHNRPDYGQYSDYYRPYDYQDSYESKRPLFGSLGTVMKLDSKPNPYGDDDHSYEVPHKIYYFNGVYNPNRPGITDVDDKLDFSPNLYYPDQNYPNRRPYETESAKKFVKISSVRGHTTSTKHFQPVFVAVQQREGDSDLELNYSDVYEFFAKPENGSNFDEFITRNR